MMLNIFLNLKKIKLKVAELLTRCGNKEYYVGIKVKDAEEKYFVKYHESTLYAIPISESTEDSKEEYYDLKCNLRLLEEEEIELVFKNELKVNIDSIEDIEFLEIKNAYEEEVYIELLNEVVDKVKSYSDNKLKTEGIVKILLTEDSIIKVLNAMREELSDRILKSHYEDKIW